jgi:hypothetical protein
VSTTLDPDRLAYALWKPRRDDPERYDEQTACYNSRHSGVTFLIGGNGAGTSETMLAKVADFVFHQQEAPRHDTPFWIISATYDKVCRIAWKEKLFGHGHIPEAEIDRPRIVWKSEKEGEPFSVPLKPWVGGHPHHNWRLHFMSYEQGIFGFSGESIGGFLFIEQFPWSILTEVLRGCREYAFVGNKLAEFTPIEPGLSDELEEMDTDGRLLPDWAIYHANTLCALEHGHVTQEWFDNFFGMVSPEMLETRLTGKWPSYEGVIYTNFNKAIHTLDLTDFDFPPGAWHRRAIDWGSGPSNAFAAYWAYRTGSGIWVFYDEYFSNDTTKTLIDHLCGVSDRWPWPIGNGHYGTTWADPSDPGNFRIAAKLSEYAPGYKNLPMSAARNRVLEGIESVRVLLRPNPGLVSPFGHLDPEKGCPRILICSKRCPNLIREFRTYRWLKASETGLNPKDARQEPLKRDDHGVDAARYLVHSEERLGEGTQKHSSVDKDLRTIDRGIQLKRDSQRRPTLPPGQDDPLKRKRNRGTGYGGG